MQRLLRVSVAVIGDNSLLIFTHSKYSRALNVQMLSENLLCSLRACYQTESLLVGIFRPCKFIKMSFNKVTINPLLCLYPASWRPVNDNAPSEMIRKRWILTQTAFSPCGSMWLRIITKSFHSSCLWDDHDCSGKTWQSKSHSTCLSEEFCASVEFWIGSCSLTWQLIWVFIQTSRKYQFFHSSAA